MTACCETNLTLTQAARLLDWLECRGIAADDVTIDGGLVTVRWRE